VTFFKFHGYVGENIFKYSKIILAGLLPTINVGCWGRINGGYWGWGRQGVRTELE